MNRFFSFLCLASVLCFVSLGSAQEETLTESEKQALAESIVAKARDYLGGGDKLDAIDTIKMSGVLVYGSGDSGTVESVFKRPNYHQFISAINAYKETTTLNRTEAWRKVESLDRPGSFSLDFYTIDDLQHLEATVRDTFDFLKVPSTRKGSIEYLGTEEVEGEEALVLQYNHNDRIWFRRYFDPETGRVRHMMNDKGIVFTYFGEIEVDGVKFPEKIVVRFLTQFGTQSMEISYTTIKLNEKVSSDRFNVPVAAE